MSAGFLIAQDTLTPILERLARKLTPAQQSGFLLGWGRAVAVQAQRNALAKGGRRFWRELARSVNVRALSSAGVEVASDHVAAAQKQYGGAIEAPGKGPGSHGARALTIPIPGSEAEGKTVADFVLGSPKLFVLGKKDGERAGVLGFSEGGVFHALFILRKRTKRIAAEPWFPDDAKALETGDKLAAKRLALT